MTAKDLVRSLTPPVLWNLARHLTPRPPTAAEPRPAPFTGPLASWTEAARQSDGWDAEVITRKTLELSLQLRDGRIAFQQDTIVRDSIRYSATTLAFLLLATGRRTGRVDLVDFGGSLGTNFYQNRKVFDRLATGTLRWNVVERPGIAALGREHFTRPDLRFFASLDELDAALSPPVEAFLFSGSLQCVEEPMQTLERVIRMGATLLAFDRLLVSPGDEHGIFVQHPNAQRYYAATYPVWCFSKRRFIEHLREQGFDLVDQFTDAPGRTFDHCGLLFVRTGATA